VFGNSPAKVAIPFDTDDEIFAGFPLPSKTVYVKLIGAVPPVIEGRTILKPADVISASGTAVESITGWEGATVVVIFIGADGVSPGAGLSVYTITLYCVPGSRLLKTAEVEFLETGVILTSFRVKK
jgi:hypothetical protein